MLGAVAVLLLISICKCTIEKESPFEERLYKCVECENVLFSGDQIIGEDDADFHVKDFEGSGMNYYDFIPRPSDNITCDE